VGGGVAVISRPSYCSREDVKRAPDFEGTARGNAQIDRAIQSVSDLIDGELHRVFYPRDATYKFDWPNSSFAPPWRLWFGQWDLIAATSVESPHGTTIPLSTVIFRPVNRKPGWPYTHMEIDRSTSSAFGAGPTPQLAIWMTGTWGFTADTDPAGTLTAAVSDTTGTTVTVSDSSLLGVGDLAIVDSERMLVTERRMVDTTVAFTGLSSASAADNILGVPDGTKFSAGEVLQFDTERCLVSSVTGNSLELARAWDGTILAAHTSGTIYAARQLTVARGQLGTAAATHSNAAPVSRHRPPGLIRDLGIAESVNRVLQETSGYARTVGGPDGAMPAPGVALADLWDEARTTYGRKARTRAL
jgi:hypothetical protein